MGPQENNVSQLLLDFHSGHVTGSDQENVNICFELVEGGY